MADKLTEKQRKWIDYYKAGHTATEAAMLAGYKAKDYNSYGSIGSENLQKLAKHLQERETVLEQPRVASMEEVNQFWTTIIRDEGQSTKDRLKASELRARAAGAFTEKVEHSGEMKVEATMSLADKMVAIREAVGSYGR